MFAAYAKAIGLDGYHLSNMDEIATISHQYYDNHLRGGEGHMEVGKLIQHVEHRKTHMVISVKPFGCMPSSGVSDGVQSLVTAKHPEAIFCAIETTGDAAINVQSRVLMDLFKARRVAQAEYDDMLAAAGVSAADAARAVARRGFDRALFYPRHVVAGTAANTIAQLKRGVRLDARRATAAVPAAATDRRADGTVCESAAVKSGAPARAGVTFRNGAIRLIPNP